MLFIADEQKAGRLISDEKASFFNTVRFALRLMGQAYGALEHGTSSVYYLPDYGTRTYTRMLNDVVIHEFMHIYTPLSLHSNLIGDFNYRNPKMSKHLWLYEGVTEYFSLLIQMQGNLVAPEKMLQDDIRLKIAQSFRYPDSIAFTEMSANVLEKPYTKLYDQVYERGAIWLCCSILRLCT